MRILAGRLAAAACLAIAIGAAPAAQTQTASQQAPQPAAQAQQPSFRTGTELVVVDVSVLGKDGAPVKGLQPEDFAVRIDGTPRRVASMKFVDQAASEAGAPAPAAAPATRTPRPVARYSSNESGGGGRLVLILVDEASIRLGGLRAAAESIDRLLAGFGPSDRIALVTLPGPRMLVEYTTDRARIGEALKGVTGGAVSESPWELVYMSVNEAFLIDRSDSATFNEVVNRECLPNDKGCPTTVQMEAKRIVTEERNRAADFIAGLRGFLTALRAIDAPKLVVVFSEGFPSPEAPAELGALGGEAAAARAVIYAMRLDRSMFDASRPRQGPITDAFGERQAAIAGLDALTGAARGAAFEIIGSAENPFKRLAAEISGYYLVGVEPEAADRNGQPHQIRVDVKRPGVTLRFRREFTYRPVITDEAKLFATAVSSPLVASDLPLKVGTFNLADEDPAKVRVLVEAEIDRAQEKDGSAYVGFVLIDDKGKPALTTARRMALARVESGALSFVGAFPVAPGTYTMRFAAVHDGKIGSVEHHVEARLTPAGVATGKPPVSPVLLGDLVVMAPMPAQKVLAPPFESRVSGDRIVGFSQVAMDPRAKAERSFVFDIVKEEKGPSLLSAPGTFDAAGKGRVRTVETAIDARLLPPGDYVLRLTVREGGPPIATLLAPFAFERAAPSARAPAAAGAKSVPPPGAARFQPQDVLDPSVLGPFVDEVVRVAPESSRAALDEAKTGRFGDALKLKTGAKPGDPTEPFLRGLMFYSEGQLQPARDSFSQAIAVAPQMLVGAFYIGACYAAAGNDRSAINAWQTSLIALGSYPIVYRLVADALIRTGQLDRARALIEQASARWPNDETFGARAMTASLEAGRYEQALAYADRIIERQPTDTATLYSAMRAIFQAVMEKTDAKPEALLPRLQRYYDLYSAAGGPQQALAAEWLAFVRSRT